MNIGSWVGQYLIAAAVFVPIDMAWGTVLASGVSAGTYQLWRLFT